MKGTDKLLFTSIRSQLPSEWREPYIRQQIKWMNEISNRKIIVLDDDPTGVQTVHNVDVLTDWDRGLLMEAFDNEESVFYILTNTRGVDAAEAERINREIVQNVYEVAAEKGIHIVFISRSDSTLRGHYPLEIEIVSDEMYRLTGVAFDGHLIIPAFFEGGRVTYENTHYIVSQDVMLPVHESEFATDRVFGYKHGELTRWVEEKTDGRVQPDNCVVITVDDIRQGPEVVQAILMKVEGNAPVIINAISYADLDVVSVALLQAENKGKKFVYRTAASFVKAYCGISDREYLPKEQLIAQGLGVYGGLVVVGSYVQTTTRQLEQLITNNAIVPLEMDVERILNSSTHESEIERLIREVNEQLIQGTNVVVYSSRQLIAFDSKKANLDISQTVSAALVQIVQSLKVSPKFIIAKGGITSSDVATKGIGIRKARVLGQACAGVPVWKTGTEAKFSGMPYIVFPGNVGTDTTLLEILERIEG